MDVHKLIELFKATLDPSKNEQTEKQLEEIHKIIGFLPLCLQIVMESTIEMPIRQAAAVFLKNEIFYYWIEKDPKSKQGSIPYSIHEQDRALIRSSIVDALVLAPDVLRNTLAFAVHYVSKHDFPNRWTEVVDKIVLYMRSSEPNHWMGALIVLLQLTKNYEYQTNEDKAPLLDAMKVLGPMMYKLMTDILHDSAVLSVWMQKTILKIIFILTQYQLSLSLFTQKFFTQWMEVIGQILDRPLPPEVNNVDVEERNQLPWYKAKKWALHIIVRIFERYGPSKKQSREYKAFGKWYIETFSVGFITVILKMLDQHNQRVYYPPRILQQCIAYLTTCVEYMHTWKILKPNIFQIIEKVIFPLLCHSEEDEELWQTDPEEFVRKKFDFFEDYSSPVSAAQQFLNTCCKKRKDMLNNTVSFAIQILNPDSLPQYKDGALHMLGSVSDLILKKKVYYPQINNLFTFHVFPYFKSEHAFLRARAAWILHFFDNFDFDNDLTVCQIVTCLQNALINETELPVKVQAAISLQNFIIKQQTDKLKQVVEQNLDKIVLECLNLVKISYNDDVTTGLQKVIWTYSDKILPISVKIVENLVYILESVLQTNCENNDNTITMMGLLNTIDAILMMIEDQNMKTALEPYAINAILMIFNQNVQELYEECFNIVTGLTDKRISNDMWKIYELIFQIATKPDSIDCLMDILPSLHNFITVDPDAFISEPNRIVVLYEICKLTLDEDCGEDNHCNAVKLIEVFFLQFREKVANYIPSFCEIIMNKYSTIDHEQSQELRTLCIQVLLVVLYINPDLFFQTIAKIEEKFSFKNFLNHLLEQWLFHLNLFLGLHDRKMCILALCKLLSLPPDQMPPRVKELAPEFMPNLLKLFSDLKEAYKAKANAERESDDSDSEYSTTDYDDDDDENEDDESTHNQKEHTEMDEGEYETDTDDDSLGQSDDDNELTALENYETTIDKDDSFDDEYILFRKTVEYLKQTDPNFYQILFGNLAPSQITILEDVFVLAQRRQDAAESRKIEQSGGYVFSNQTIPTTFNFGASNTFFINQ